ncbi:HTH_Tnp_Tc3_2 domain-containing protein [Trichonephila clavipes]|nr:HTH_Tnp_Tc3_2 domain-containing protein [Trichonephila clavipes]
MIVGSSSQGMAVPQEDQVPGGHVALLRGKSAVYGLRARRSVACIQLVPSRCRLRFQWCQARAHCWMKEGSALVPVMTMYWSEGRQSKACNQIVCGLYTLDLHLEPWSGKQFPMTTGALVFTGNTLTTNLYVSLFIQGMSSRRQSAFDDESPCHATVFRWFKELISGGNFLQDEEHTGRPWWVVIPDKMCLPHEKYYWMRITVPTK